MLQVSVRIPPDAGDTELQREVLRVLRCRRDDLLEWNIIHRSLDARKKPVFLCTVAVQVRDEASALRRGGRHVSRMDSDTGYAMPSPPEITRDMEKKTRPVVVGAGPAGLFAALVLANAGLRPVLIERGGPVEQRREEVNLFRRNGILNPNCNVQFGEGGAGTFSDGKLHTGTRDPRHRFILEQFVSFGAPPEILIDAKPHIGTDYLYHILPNFRQKLTESGADVKFYHTLTGLDTDQRNQKLRGIKITGPDGEEYLPCTRLILAPGHSARDTFAILYQSGVSMLAKAFAVGVRIEHLQSEINIAQYKKYAGRSGLPPASYQLSCHLPVSPVDYHNTGMAHFNSGRGVFSFCVCPGGEVIAAASEAGGIVTNGMSEYARGGENINGGLLVSVTPADFGGDTSPLAGIAFQRNLEQAAFRLANPDINNNNINHGFFAPVQRVGDFLNHIKSTGPGSVRPTYRPGVTWTDLHDCLPPWIADALAQAIPVLGHKLRGFDNPDAVLTGIESRSSSPVRVSRDGFYQSSVRGLYPCGEGAGYAGGIMSAATDGILCAEALLRDWCNPDAI